MADIEVRNLRDMFPELPVRVTLAEHEIQTPDGPRTIPPIELGIVVMRVTAFDLDDPSKAVDFTRVPEGVPLELLKGDAFCVFYSPVSIKEQP